jgi:hypothetical protein
MTVILTFRLVAYRDSLSRLKRLKKTDGVERSLAVHTYFLDIKLRYSLWGRTLAYTALGPQTDRTIWVIGYIEYSTLLNMQDRRYCF